MNQFSYNLKVNTVFIFLVLSVFVSAHTRADSLTVRPADVYEICSTLTTAVQRIQSGNGEKTLTEDEEYNMMVCNTFVQGYFIGKFSTLVESEGNIKDQKRCISRQNLNIPDSLEVVVKFLEAFEKQKRNYNSNNLDINKSRIFTSMDGALLELMGCKS